LEERGGVISQHIITGPLHARKFFKGGDNTNNFRRRNERRISAEVRRCVRISDFFREKIRVDPKEFLLTRKLASSGTKQQRKGYRK